MDGDLIKLIHWQYSSPKVLKRKVQIMWNHRLRSSANLNIENDDKYCLFWSILASLHPCNNNDPNQVSNLRQHFIELNFRGCDFSDGFECSDVKNIKKKTNNLSMKTNELSFYQDQSKWKKIFPAEVIKKIQLKLLT